MTKAKNYNRVKKQEKKLRIVKINPAEAGLAGFDFIAGNFEEFEKKLMQMIVTRASEKQSL